MNQHVILGIHLAHRLQHAPRVQQLLSAYGCQIKTRIGLHDAGNGYCSSAGLILLELAGDPVKGRELERKLKALRGVQVKRMAFQ